MCSAVFLDATTGQTKTARHVAFDEGMADVNDPPPYVKYLQNPDHPLESVNLDQTVPLARSNTVKGSRRSRLRSAHGALMIVPKRKHSQTRSHTRVTSPQGA